MAPKALSPEQARVLGALVEKETTTPEYYPLSLNALVNACNQKNNREPVMQLTEEEVRQALHGLEEQGLAGAARGSEDRMGSRVTKYGHRLQEAYNFTRGETAVICVLLLRGPQTPGELRGRTERIYRFAELEDVAAVLQKLMQREPALVTALPRQRGTKEIRYVELLSAAHPERESHTGEGRGEPFDSAASPAQSSMSREDRLEKLEGEVARLREEIEQLRAELSAMRMKEGGA